MAGLVAESSPKRLLFAIAAPAHEFGAGVREGKADAAFQCFLPAALFGLADNAFGFFAGASLGFAGEGALG